MVEQDSNLHDQGVEGRREFLKRVRTLAGLAAILSTAALPDLGRSEALTPQSLTPQMRADAWFLSKLSERIFVESDYGSLNKSGVRGYYSGGPGASASSIYATLRGAGRIEDPAGFCSNNHPNDSDDFGRCVELLNLVPEWRDRMGEMRSVSLQWSRLSTKWSELENLYRAGQMEGVTCEIRIAIGKDA